MPGLTLRLTSKQAEDLRLVCRLGADRLSKVRQVLEARDATLINPVELRSVIASASDDQTAQAMARLLMGLATLLRRTTAKTQELITALSEAVVAADFEESDVKAWRNCKDAVSALLSSRHVTLAAKAVDLTYDFTQFCIGARILTDIRPVFDDARDQMVGAAITQTLRLDYASADGQQGNISISLDIEDIRQLQSACEAALRKAAAARRAIEDKLRIPTISAGEVENE